MFAMLVKYFIIITIVLRKNHMKKPDDFIDDDDDDDDEDDYAVYGYGNNPNVINDVELEVKNTQYTKAKQHVLSSNL